MGSPAWEADGHAAAGEDGATELCPADTAGSWIWIWVPSTSFTADRLEWEWHAVFDRMAERWNPAATAAAATMAHGTCKPGICRAANDTNVWMAGLPECRNTSRSAALWSGSITSGAARAVCATGVQSHL